MLYDVEAVTKVCNTALGVTSPKFQLQISFTRRTRTNHIDNRGEIRIFAFCVWLVLKPYFH